MHAEGLAEGDGPPGGNAPAKDLEAPLSRCKQGGVDMKKVVWRNGWHMLFESDHKEFNRQVDSISTGNVIGNAQLSFYIRPKSEIECNGHPFPEGHLRNIDLGYFNDGLPNFVKETVYAHTENESVILYEFRHWARGKTNIPHEYVKTHRKIAHGYVITTGEHHLIKAFVTGPTRKSESVIIEAVKYICDDEDLDELMDFDDRLTIVYR
jgi:hypothetical protein